MRHPNAGRVLALANVILCGFLAETWWLGAAWGAVVLVLLAVTGGRGEQVEVLQVEAGAQADEQQLLKRLQGLVASVLPLWGRHLGLARTQVGGAISGLSCGFAELRTEERRVGNGGGRRG